MFGIAELKNRLINSRKHSVWNLIWYIRNRERSLLSIRMLVKTESIVLLEQESGIERVIAYYRSSFSKAVRNYCVTRKDPSAAVKTNRTLS